MKRKPSHARAAKSFAPKLELHPGNNRASVSKVARCRCPVIWLRTQVFRNLRRVVDGCVGWLTLICGHIARDVRMALKAKPR